MIVGDITRFTNKGMGLAMRVLADGLAALLALTFLNLTVLPGTALAEEADGVDAATEHLVLPAPEEPEAGSNVFVYLHLSGPALDTAKAAGLEVNREGWFTVGVIALEGIAKPSEKPLNYEVDQPELEAMQSQIDTALRSINYYPGAQALSLSAAKWTSLKVCSGATDYAAAGHTWHLDGELCDQLVNFDVRYIDAEGNALAVGDVDDQGNKTDTRTILAAVGSEIAADDQIIDIEGYEYSKDLTTEKNGGESVTVAAEPLARSSVSGMTLVYEKKAEEPVRPENPGDNDPTDKPVVPDDDGNGSVDNDGGVKPQAPSDNETPKVPSIKVPAPSTPQQSQSNAQNNDNAAGANGGGFNAGERTTVSEPAPQAGTAKVVLAETAPAEQPAAETVSIDDDATPMVARVGGAEAIAEEDVPMGAFDAPVDPAPWVAGLGAIGTALWGVVAVRRRLVMAQQLATFESQVLGNSAVEADAVAVPNAGHQAL